MNGNKYICISIIGAGGEGDKETRGWRIGLRIIGQQPTTFQRYDQKYVSFDLFKIHRHLSISSGW